MAFDPEEFKQRRAEREQLRQQRQKQQRSLRRKLIIAGIALVCCAVLILVLAGTGNPSSDSAAQNPVNTDIPETSAPSDTTVIHLAAAGDLNVTEAVVASGGVNCDYTQTLLDIAHLLAHADITTVNFEGTLTGDPYGVDRSAPQSLVQALSKAGVDLVQLANSYSIYKGMEGLRTTISGMRLAGIEPVGVYGSVEDAKSSKGYTIRTVQGIKIAFVAFTKGMDGMALPPGNEGCVNVLYSDYSTDYQVVDTEGISKVLDAVAKAKPDITVALLHWGSEYNNTISTSQSEICTLLQEKGVDAIIGTHSHYVQQITYDADASTFVAYSLGDFLGDASRAGSEYSILLDLEITKDNNSGKTSITGYSYTPIFTVVEENKPLRILRIHEAMKSYEEGYLDRISGATYDAMAYALQRIEARVAGN